MSDIIESGPLHETLVQVLASKQKGVGSIIHAGKEYKVIHSRNVAFVLMQGNFDDAYAMTSFAPQDEGATPIVIRSGKTNRKPHAEIERPPDMDRLVLEDPD